MGDVETLSKKGQETKKIRKRVNAGGKRHKKPRQKVEKLDETIVRIF